MVQKRKSTAFYRGSAGREKADEELARQKARAEARKEQGNQPFRFRVAVGGTTQFVILDDAPDFYRFEHNLKNPQTGFWDTFTGCIKEWDNCPVCEAAGRDSYYALYFSVLDLTEFKTKDGTKHEFSRKLLVVKPAQQKKFIRAYTKAEKEGRTLRGAIFEVTRDGDKDSSIGNDIEFIEFMEEDELAGYVRSWKDKDGKKHTEDCSEPYDYDAMFEEPDADQLRALVGAEPTPGSRAHERKALGGSSSRRGRKSDDDDDDEAYEKPERNQKMHGKGRSRDEEDEDEDEGDEAPRRPARSRKGEDAAPARRTASRRGRDEEDGDEDDDDAPPARRTSRATAAKGRGRNVDDDPPFDPDEDDDDGGKAPGVGRRVKARGRR